MIDAISRQAVELRINEFFTNETYTEEMLRNDVNNLPPAQPEIIRCKDCKWKQGSECVRFADVRPFPDDFCSRAERKTGENT